MVFTGGFKWLFACVTFSFGRVVGKISMLLACNEKLLLWCLWTTCNSWLTRVLRNKRGCTLGFFSVSNLRVTDCLIPSYLPASSKSKLLLSLFHLCYFMNFMNPIHQTVTASVPAHYVILLQPLSQCHIQNMSRHHIHVYSNMLPRWRRQLQMKAGSACRVVWRLSGFQNIKACHVIRRAHTPPLQIPPMMHAGMLPFRCICRLSENCFTLLHIFFFFYLFFSWTASGVKWIQSILRESQFSFAVEAPYVDKLPKCSRRLVFFPLLDDSLPDFNRLSVLPRPACCLVTDSVLACWANMQRVKWHRESGYLCQGCSSKFFWANVSICRWIGIKNTVT